MPAYNSKQYIAATIHSLLDQTYTNLEIIVADDGSTDGTVALLQNITDERFKYISLPNRGAAAARNTAYGLSSGQYIKFMDSDDLTSRDSIASQLEKIIDQPQCIASAKWGRFYKEDATDFKLAIETVWKDLTGIDWMIESLIESGGNMMQPGIFLIPRQIIEKAGLWNEQLNLIDDFDFMTRVILSADQVLFCENAVLMYRSGGKETLSAQKSPAHLQSAYNSITFGISNILQHRNDTISRLASANTLQRWAYEFYPSRKDLCLSVEKRIKELGGSNIMLGGGKGLIMLSKIIGWKLATQLKLLLQK